MLYYIVDHLISHRYSKALEDLTDIDNMTVLLYTSLMNTVVVDGILQVGKRRKASDKQDVRPA